MLNYLEQRYRNSGQIGQAEIIKGLRKLAGETPFPVIKQTLSLEQATSEYKENPTSPEHLTQFMRSFWTDAGQKIGRNIVVDNFPLTAKEIEEKTNEGYMAIFVPSDVSLADLGIIYPNLKNYEVNNEGFVVDKSNSSGWLWIEASVEVPNKNMTQRQLEEKFQIEEKQGQTLRSYIIGNQVNYLKEKRYFDQTFWSRLPGSYVGGKVIIVSYNSFGNLEVVYDVNPEYHIDTLGGHSEKVINS